MDPTPGRSNGLPAIAWTPMADLDPQLADAMLTILRDEGVAAYVRPAGDSRGSFLEVRLPNQPTDRLFVDTAAAARAREVLVAQLPRLRAALYAQAEAARRQEVAVDEAAWAEIVAAFEEPAVDPVPRWPVTEDITEEVTETLGGPTLAPPPPPSRPSTPRPQRPPDDPSDHFQPPEPPPIPTGSPVSRLAWGGVFGGPAFIVLAALAGWRLDGPLALVPLLAFVGGFVTLIVRMHERPDDQDNPDDGAVV